MGWAITCPPDLAVCPAGHTGNGGCYSEVFGGCTDGVVFESGKAVCPRGLYGAGGTYDPDHTYCTTGVLVPKGMAFCPGSNGNGNIYPPARFACQNGLLVGKPVTLRALGRTDSPRPSMQPLPLGNQKACPAGAKGPGGTYVPGFASCDQGLIH